MTQAVVERQLAEAGRPAVEVDNLTVAYGSRSALSGVNAHMEKGQIVGVIGPNGAGKSTLLKAIVGLVPVLAGTITIHGKAASKQRHEVAYVPQREEVNWEFPVSVEDVVLMGRYGRIGWFRRAGSEDRRRVDEALEMVDLADIRDRHINQLSGGQQQRVFLARALAQDASVLLLDEPLSGVDATSQERILQLLHDLAAAGRTVVMATHDLSSAACNCHCVCCLNHEMVAMGPPAETLSKDNLHATYGGQLLILGEGEFEPALEVHEHHG
ncbi:MAG TPA: metal ABC transporter ATP-binding protein [Dehalococcoidia bacterium]|nr:metal ABC transporter ATP-binding protein [Dehalococcoidia bacterium]